MILCVRPENVNILPQDAHTPSGVTILPAAILSRTYLGQSRQYICRLPDGTTWKATQLGPAQREFAIGEGVKLIVPAEKVILLAE